MDKAALEANKASIFRLLVTMGESHVLPQAYLFPIETPKGRRNVVIRRDDLMELIEKSINEVLNA